MARCKDCIHYSICSLWTTSDLDEDEAYKYCFGNFKETSDVVPKSEVVKWKEINVQLHKEMSEQMIEERKIERKYVAREIFEEINTIKKEYASGDIDGNELYVRLYMLEKKYTEEKK